LQQQQQQMPHDDTDHVEQHHNHHNDAETKVPLGSETNILAEQCAYNVYERSVYLSTLFGDEDSHVSTRSRYPLPSYIFAESHIARHSQHKMNFREVETVGRVADLAHELGCGPQQGLPLDYIGKAYGCIRHGNIISYPRPLPLYRPKYITYLEVTSETEDTETNVRASHRNDAFPNIRHIYI
jgi:hypothetical protein